MHKFETRSDSLGGGYLLLMSTPTKRSCGIFSHTILMLAIIGTASAIPVIPHNQPQKSKERMTRSGLKFSRCPINLGSTKPPSTTLMTVK
jgi:hypothetical protein